MPTQVQRELDYLTRNSARIDDPDPHSEQSFVWLVERQARRRPDAVAIISDRETVTWRELMSRGLKIANLLHEMDVHRGESVALNMGNCASYIAAVFGITRIGAVASLINTNLRSDQLIHCVREVGANVSLLDAAAAARVAEAGGDYPAASPGTARFVVWDAVAGDDETAAGSQWLWLDEDAIDRLPSTDLRDVPPPLAREAALHIFTSGTTGFPKAAVLGHRRVVYGASSHSIFSFRARPQDRLYNCLPLYHGTSLIAGAGACLFSGASMFLRPSFSASQLVAEAKRHECNLLIYVGEICRYLLSTPPRADDAQCSITRAAGNGLRPEIWKPFKKRFGIRRVSEFYGASEANGGFMNVFNRDATLGITSATIRLVAYDADTTEVLRDKDGRAIDVRDGEPGLMLIKVTDKQYFEGYTNKQMSDRRIEHDILQDGDRWFNSGDVLRTVDVGLGDDWPHYQFVERLGDGFRWKSENVAASAVEQALLDCPGLDAVAVYGVQIPGTEGKAGMAAIEIAGDPADFDLSELSLRIKERLPDYARPVFLRLMSQLPMTATFKVKKSDLAHQGFNPGVVSDSLYLRDPDTGSYRRLDVQTHALIARGALRL